MTSKRYKKLPEKTKDLNSELIEKLLPVIKKNCTTKFDESIDLSFQVNNKQKKGEVNIRTVVNLPGGNGKKVKEEWYIKDNLHRKNGPAYITYYNSIIIKKYYKNGIHIPELDIYINKST